MRASCEIDLIDGGTSIQALARWMGHSFKVAVANYLRVREEHLDKAVSGQTLQNPLQGSQRTGLHAVQWSPVDPTKAGQDDQVQYYTYIQADGEGFEPPVQFPTQQFSRLPP